MAFKNFGYIINDSSSFLSGSYNPYHHNIKRAFFIQKDDLKFISSSVLLQNSFGKENDVLEFCLYDENDNIVKWDTFNASGSYQAITRSYYDINGNLQQYYYKQFNPNSIILNGTVQTTSSLIISGSASLQKYSDELLISPLKNLMDYGIDNGSYTVSYTMLRNIVGSSKEDDRLYIKFISTDRTEIVLIPDYPRNDTEHEELITDFYTFGNKTYKIKDIIKDLVDNLDNNNISNIFYEFVDDNLDLFEEIKLVYGFKNKYEVFKFCFGIFEKIRKQFQHTLYASYECSVTFQKLDDYFNRLCSARIENALLEINNNLDLNAQRNFILYVAFFYNIFDKVLGMENIKDKYHKLYYGPFRNYLNFGNSSLQPIIKWEYTKIEQRLDPELNYPIVVKLLYSLPTEFKVGSKCWISNLLSSPRIFNVSLFTERKIITKRLKPANFSIKIQNESETTKAYNFDELIGSGSLITQKIINYINQNYLEENINIDYTKLENFVHFSTVKDRIENFDTKLEQLSDYENKISQLNAFITQSYNIYYETEKLKYINKIQEIKSSFDGYERFLYYSPLHNGESWRDIHWASASLYDEFNDNSLINNTPREIIENPDNSEYRKFLAMIGHHYDLIYSYINNIPTVKFAENDPFLGIAQNMIYHMLSSFGFDAYSGIDNQDLWLSVFGDSPDSTEMNLFASGSLEAISGKDRTRTIWRRILNNLSYIVKTKGSEEAIRALMSCYGIPKYLFKIREYGGIEYTSDVTQDSLFIFDNNNYFLRFSSSLDYIESPWYDDIKTIEFKVAFKPNELSENGDTYRILLNDNKWALGFIRDKGVWGRGYFTITDSLNNVQSMVTDSIPIFNGDVFSVMLRKNDINEKYNVNFSASLEELDLVPTTYDMVVKRSDDERIIFDVSNSIILSGSYNKNFRDGEKLYIGNYSASVNNEFFGNIDQFRLWTTALSNERFTNHTMFIEAYDTENPYETVNNLVLKMDFSQPFSLYTTSSYVEIYNTSYNLNRINTLKAYNFLNINEYPYNFTLYETREIVKIPNFGSNKFRNNKIRIDDQYLLCNLSPISRSSLKASDRNPVDSGGLGIFFSPVDLIDRDILRFFGNYNIADFIGSPSDLYKKNYKHFNKFREVYFKHGGGLIDFQTYINLVKAYFDKSIFKHLEQLVPARSNFKSGLLIEPSLLERNKYEWKKVEHKQLQKECLIEKKDILDINLIYQPTSSIDVVDNLHKTYNNNYFKTYMPLDEWYYQIHADNDGKVTRVINKGEFVLHTYKAEILPIKKSYTLQNESGSYTTFTKEFEMINLIDLGPNFTGSIDNVSISPNGRVLKGYPKNHFKTKRNVLGRNWRQTKDTTVNKNGLLDGSLPFEKFLVDRTVISVENTNSQSTTILGTE